MFTTFVIGFKKNCPTRLRFVNIGTVILLTGVNKFLPVISTFLEWFILNSAENISARLADQMRVSWKLVQWTPYFTYAYTVTPYDILELKSALVQSVRTGSRSAAFAILFKKFNNTIHFFPVTTILQLQYCNSRITMHGINNIKFTTVFKMPPMLHKTTDLFSFPFIFYQSQHINSS